MDTHSPLAIEATALVKSFGDTRAVDGVDLAVRTGSIYGVLGPNGAGKTTTIRMLATLIRPDGGSARVLGHDIVTEADAVRTAVSLTGQLASVDESLTGRENLILLGRLLGTQASRGQAPRLRADRCLRAPGGGEPPGQELLGRHAAQARYRRQHRGHAGPHVSRRTDDGPRSPIPQPGLGHHPGPGGRGHHDPSAPSTWRRPTSSPTGSRSSTAAR